MRSIFICLSFVVLTVCKTPTADTPPNIVLIFIDDMGYADTGVTGATGFSTPHIDRLANEGLQFTHFYSAQAVCSASRAALLTGCYPNRIGISGALNHSAQHGIHENEVTIAEMLRAQGYRTAVFGKWHLGHHEKFLPLQNGFEEFTGLPYSNDMWPVDFDGKPHTGRKSGYPPLPLIEGNEPIRYIETLDDQSELTTIYTEKAVDFINRNAKVPFFLYLPHSMVHVPLGVSEKFKGKSEQGLYGDVVMEVDWSVGQVMQALESNGIQDNTLVIFTSDNGPWLNFGNHAGSTGGFREGKGTSWEGGQRVPAFMKWPARIAAGSVTSQLAAAMDIFPTLAAIAGGKLPDHKIDGVNILPILEGDRNAEPREEFLFYYNRNDLEAVRKGTWKLVLPHSYRSYEGVLPGKDGWPGPYARKSTEIALYDLRRDPGERYNVMEQHPEIVEDLLKLAEEARKDLGDNITDRVGDNVREAGWIGDEPTARKLGAPHLAAGAAVSYVLPPSSQYTAGGPGALVDNQLGSVIDFQRSWQGWEGVDADLTLDMGEIKDISSISVSFLRGHGSWIFLPGKVEVHVSSDGSTFEKYGEGGYQANADDKGSKVEEMKFSKEYKARYLRLKATNLGKCPEWHEASGEACWLFIDEIVVR